MISRSSEVISTNCYIRFTFTFTMTEHTFRIVRHLLHRCPVKVAITASCVDCRQRVGQPDAKHLKMAWQRSTSHNIRLKILKWRQAAAVMNK